jgi:hypothetical protein
MDNTLYKNAYKHRIKTDITVPIKSETIQLSFLSNLQQSFHQIIDFQCYL